MHWIMFLKTVLNSSCNAHIYMRTNWLLYRGLGFLVAVWTQFGLLRNRGENTPKINEQSVFWTIKWENTSWI